MRAGKYFPFVFSWLEHGAEGADLTRMGGVEFCSDSFELEREGRWQNVTYGHPILKRRRGEGQHQANPSNDDGQFGWSTRRRSRLE
jgi:hypothetical protein